MAEIDCFIEFQNAEPFMMSIDKDVNYQTFDEEIKKRLSKNIQDVLVYSYDSLNGETFIQNNNDLVNALAHAESFGDDFLFVIKIAEKQKNNEEEFEEEEYEEEVEDEKELKELEELEKLVPEEQKESSFSVPIVDQKTENVNDHEEKKDSDKKDERVDFFEFLKNQISEQLPTLSPILESLNIENIINNNVNNNDHNENINKDNMREVLEEIPNIVKQFLPAVLDNLQNLPNTFPIPPPPPHPHPHPLAQAFPFPPPPPPSQCHPFAQAFPFPFPFPPVPSPCKSSEQKSAEQVHNPFPFLSAFVPPSNQSSNPFIDLLNGVLNSKQMPQNKCSEKPKQRPTQFHMAKCDHCDRQILGIRYKCLTCEDFDLCEKCEVNSPQVHNPDHIFAKIRNVNQTIAPLPIPQPAPHRQNHMHPHIHRVPHDHPLKPRSHPHFHPHLHPHPMSHFTTITQPSIKPNVVRVVPPHVHPQFPSHANVHRAPQPPHGCKVHAHSVPIVQSRPKPVPENNRVKTLEEQIASLESQIANIKSSLPQREPKPRTSIFNHNYYNSLDDSEDDDSDDDQVFEIKVNRRL